MKPKGLSALALVIAMLCVTTSASSQPLPDEDDLPDVPVVHCDDPGPYQEPGSAPEPADPLTSAACRAKGKVVYGGPTPYPAPFEPEGEHSSPGSNGGGGGSGGGSPIPDLGAPAPSRPWTQTNGAIAGIQTADGFSGHYGIYAALTVTDTRVPRNSSQYLSQRVLAKSCDRNDWFEIGWVEAGWRDNKQYIYTHDTPGSGWTFYDQYALSPGQRIYVQIVQSPTDAGLWQVYLWWNGSWQLLRETFNTDWLGCGGELMVDRYQTGQGTWFNTNGAVYFGDGSSSGVMVKNVGTNSWQTWDKSFPTAVYSGEYYCWALKTIFHQEWYWGYTHSNNCAPNTTLSVTPTSGTRLTDFQAKLSGTMDWNGDPMHSFRIDWGDGTSSYPSSAADVMTHRYANAGSYQVRGYACDDLGACAYSPAQSVHVDTTNSAPVINFDVTPTSGDRTTVFNANFNGTYDPENDAISYRIDWGDGTIDNSQSASHRYQNAGTYTVTGRACDGFGACSTSSRAVTVAFSNREPSANLTVNPKEGDTRTSFSASLTGSDPDGDSVSYRIDWGDGTTTSGSSGTHQYQSPGQYTVVGIVTDQYEAQGSDEEDVRVCVVYENGQCADQPEQPKPPPLPVPAPVWSAVSSVLQQKPEPRRLVRSSTNALMVLDANLIQSHARGNPEYTPTCGVDSHKTCGAPIRLDRFANRVEKLVKKPATATGDGMGGVVPDVILLQEVQTTHARAVARKLSTRFDTDRFDHNFDVAMSFARGNQDNPNEAAYCAEQHPSSAEDRQRCEELIITKGDSAIVFNTSTVQEIPGTERVVENRYSPEERCTPPSNAPAGGWDFDQDLRGDCEDVKWKLQPMEGFAELRKNGENTTGYIMAVASTHFVTASHFDNDLTEQEVEEEIEPRPERNAINERKKLEWSDQVASEITSIEGDPYVIAGDFNIHRCSTKDHRNEGDYPPNQECGPRSWYLNMTTAPTPAPTPVPTSVPTPLPTPTATAAPEPRGYEDAIWALHEDEGNRLISQYRDGLLPVSLDQRFRDKRIDFIFSRSASVLGSSFDLTCGQTPKRGVDPNCTDYRNDDYYSDHRLLWTLMSDGPSE